MAQPRTNRLQSAAAYAATVLLCLGLVAWSLRLGRADLRVPFYYHTDAPLFLALVKGTFEQGHWLTNPRLGAPGGLALYDFPMADSLHFFLIQLIGLATGGDPFVAYNLYYLLTYPLAAVSALYVLRRFGVSYGPAVVCGLLFALLPYHLERHEQHLFLVAYYLVPLAGLLVLRIYQGEGPFLRADDGGEVLRLDLLSRRSLGAVLLCGLRASAGVYYTFFTGFLAAVAGGAGALSRRRLYPLVPAAAVVALLLLGLLANLTPSLLYWHRHGPNPAPTQRHVWQAEMFGLRVSQLLLPIGAQRVPWLARLKAAYSEQLHCIHQLNESDAATLGLVGNAGFLFLIGRLFGRRGAGRAAVLADALGVLTVAAMLLGTVGGVGSLFSLLVSPMIRAYNRISVFIAFFSLFAVALLLDRLLAPLLRRNATRACRVAALGALLLGGVLDQTSPAFVPAYKATAREFHNDADFVARIEAALPQGACVFQLPVVPFPEGAVPPGRTYDQFRGYLHSRHLGWSFGSMRGREGDRWQAGLAAKPPTELVACLRAAGFRGVWVDRDLYPEHGQAVEAALQELLGPTVLVSADGGLAFYDLAVESPSPLGGEGQG